MTIDVDNKVLHHAPVVCDACHTVASAVVTHRGRIVSVDSATTRARGGIFHADCHGRFVLEVEGGGDDAA